MKQERYLVDIQTPHWRYGFFLLLAILLVWEVWMLPYELREVERPYRGVLSMLMLIFIHVYICASPSGFKGTLGLVACAWIVFYLIYAFTPLFG